MEKKSISDLAEAVQRARPEPREKAEGFVREFFSVISQALARERFVRVKGLGTFKAVDVSPRESVNVNTGERIEIERHLKVTFTPDNAMRDTVNRPFAHLQAFEINEGTDLDVMSQTEGFALEDMESSNRAPEAQEASAGEALPPQGGRSADGYAEDAAVDIVVEETETGLSDGAGSASGAEDTGGGSAGGAEERGDESGAACGGAADGSEEEDSVVGHAQYDTEDSGTVPPEEEEGACGLPLEEEGKPGPAGGRRRMKMALAALSGIALLCAGYAAGYYRVIDVKGMLSPARQSVTGGAAEAAAAQSAAPRRKPAASAERERPDADTAAAHIPAPIVEAKPGDRHLITGIKGVYRLKPGDGLLRIARREYGNEEFLKYILRLNEFPDPDNIAVGTEIRLPQLTLRDSV